jgi:hypothetical protein
LVEIEALRYPTRAAEGAGEGTFPRFKHDSLGSAARFGNRPITLRTEDALSDLAKIRVADKVVQIDRAVTQEIERLSSAQIDSRRRRSWSGQIRGSRQGM